MDQGVIQDLWSIALRADRRRARRALRIALGRVPLPDLIVRVDVPIEVLVDRLQARRTGQSRVERQDRKAIIRELHNGEGLLDELLGDISAACRDVHPPVFRVNANVEIEDLIDWIISRASNKAAPC